MNYSGVNTPDFYAGFHQENFYGMTYFIYYTVDLETGRALEYNDDIEDPDSKLKAAPCVCKGLPFVMLCD